MQNAIKMYELSNYLGDTFPVVEQRQYARIKSGYKLEYEKELIHAGLKAL